MPHFRLPAAHQVCREYGFCEYVKRRRSVPDSMAGRDSEDSPGHFQVIRISCISCEAHAMHTHRAVLTVYSEEREVRAAAVTGQGVTTTPGAEVVWPSILAQCSVSGRAVWLSHCP